MKFCLLRSPTRRRQRGVSIIELMIGMTLGLLTTLALVTSFSGNEVFSRAVSGRADAQQAGMLTSWRLTRQLRLSGSGFGHGPGLWGCQLQVDRGETVLLPRAAAWPAPFANLSIDLRLSPIAVSNGTGSNGSDQIVMMGATPDANVVPAPVNIVSEAQIEMNSTSGFEIGDLLLVSDATVVGPCRIGQVDKTYAPVAGIAAPRIVGTDIAQSTYNGAGGFAGMAAGGDYTLTNLGSTPYMQMIGLDDKAQLTVFDPLQMFTGAEPLPLAQDVIQMQVLYGVDDGTDGVLNDNVIDRWVAPTGAWSYANMTAAGGNALWVKALRVAIVVRSSTPSSNPGVSERVLFQDLPEALRYTVSFDTNERRFGHEIFDSVIPLRNQVSALCSQHRRAAGMPADAGCK